MGSSGGQGFESGKKGSCRDGRKGKAPLRALAGLAFTRKTETDAGTIFAVNPVNFHPPPPPPRLAAGLGPWRKAGNRSAWLAPGKTKTGKVMRFFCRFNGFVQILPEVAPRGRGGATGQGTEHFSPYGRKVHSVDGHWAWPV